MRGCVFGAAVRSLSPFENAFEERTDEPLLFYALGARLGDSAGFNAPINAAFAARHSLFETRSGAEGSGARVKQKESTAMGG